MSNIAELWDALRSAGLEAIAPTLVRHGVTSTGDLILRFEELHTAGLLRWQMEAVLAASSQTAGSGTSEAQPTRRDLPQRAGGKRANLQAALEAALPNQRQRALQLLDQDILAKSTNPAVEARIRTYQAVCRAWQVTAFPLDTENTRFMAASLKAGGYKSAGVYFQAIMGHQQRILKTPIPPIVKMGIKDYIRSIQRGLGVSQLKDSFNALLVGGIEPVDDQEPFTLQNTSHCRDMVVVGLWFYGKPSWPMLVLATSSSRVWTSAWRYQSIRQTVADVTHKGPCLAVVGSDSTTSACGTAQKDISFASKLMLIVLMAHNSLCSQMMTDVWPPRRLSSKPSGVWSPAQAPTWHVWGPTEKKHSDSMDTASEFLVHKCFPVLALSWHWYNSWAGGLAQQYYGILKTVPCCGYRRYPHRFLDPAMEPARLFNCGCTTLAHLQSLQRHHLHPKSTRHGPSRLLHQSGPCRGIWNKSNRRFKHRNKILFSGRRPRFCTKPPHVRPTMNLRNGGPFVVGAMVLGPFCGPPEKRTDPDVARNVSTWMATPVQVAVSPRPTCPPLRLRQPVAKRTKDPQLAGILKAC